MYKTDQKNLYIDLIYEITIRVECISFMIQECIEKQITINMNENIEKELIKDFEFYYNQYQTLHKYFGNYEKNEYKLTYVKQSLDVNNEIKDNDEIKDDNKIPLIKQVILFYSLTLKNIIEFPIIEKYYINFISELKNQIIQKFIALIEEIKLINEKEINQIKNIILESFVCEEKRELEKEQKEILNKKKEEIDIELNKIKNKIQELSNQNEKIEILNKENIKTIKSQCNKTIHKQELECNEKLKNNQFKYNKKFKKKISKLKKKIKYKENNEKIKQIKTEYEENTKNIYGKIQLECDEKIMKNKEEIQENKEEIQKVNKELEKNKEELQKNKEDIDKLNKLITDLFDKNNIITNKMKYYDEKIKELEEKLKEKK